VLALLRIGEGDLLAILPDGDAAEFGQALQRFVFRRKVTLQVDDRQASGSFASASLASGSTAAIAADGSIELDWGSAGLPRVLRISRDPAAGDGSAPWRQADLRLGLPRLAADQRESWTAQQLGLDWLNGYSVRKGCYPGQEIVARTHFLGKAKRATVLLHGIDEGVAAGSAVLAAEASIGQIACVAAPYALAVLPLEREDLPLSVDGQAVSQLPLLDGLQR
jgi:folate-binding protein YgfZ